jgi:RNA polymerase subunit RPABC4/transcription elongation factor Spt4
MRFDPALSTNLILALTAWAAAFLAALWLSLIFWTYRDIRARTREPLTRILAAAVTAVLFLPGVVIYLILRPARTLEDEYQQTLEEEALLQTIEDSALCPGCARRVKDAWSVCPNCHTRLKKTCRHCSRLMDLPWTVCPFCGTAEPGVRIENPSLDAALRPIAAEEADESTR